MKLKIQLKDVAVLLLVGLISLVLYFNIESYQEEVYLGQGAEVDNKLYLGLQKHLANFDTTVVFNNDVSQLFSDNGHKNPLPSTNDLVILTESEVTISQTLSNHILNWVNSGGQLVVGLTSENLVSTFSTNHLLKEIGIETKEFNRELLKEDNEEYQENVPTLVNTEKFGEIKVNVVDSIYIDLLKSQNLVFSKGVLSKPQTIQPTIVQLRMGDGLITLMSDVYIWNNYQIDEYENIVFLHQLIEYGNKIYVFEKAKVLMWYQLIPLYSPSFYWVLFVFILLCTWFASIRFGAIKLVNDHVVTYFSQHIRAAGQFYWANNQQEKLLNAVRSQVIEDVSSKLSKSNLKQDQIVEALVVFSNWPKEQVYYYLFESKKLNESQFTQIIQGLQQLRKMI